ncbi:ABC transporter permease [Anatilimnocola floriformis]|uniref:ABC transporter permease n=1 Tax=Anatilimnocola floriformis TaxID=2948575 RepID=UPI0020C4C816|nr:ABC transporter permease subunit [Anatilimnocola floriformis]
MIEHLMSAAALQQLKLSLLLAVGSAAIAIAFALPLAVLLMRAPVVGLRAAWFVLALLLFAPLYVQLAGWDAVGAWTGWYGRMAPEAFLSGIAASTWVHGVAAVPWATVVIAAGIQQLPRKEEELALLEAPPLTMFWHVILPRLAPWMVVAGSLAMVTAWQDMTVTNVYLVPTVTEGIYNQLALNASDSAIYLLPGFVVVGGLFALGMFAAHFLLTADFPTTSPGRIDWSKGRLATLVVWTFLLFLAGVPLFVLIRQAGLQLRLEENHLARQWSFQHFGSSLWRTVRTMHREYLWTLLTAAVAASLSLFIATTAAWWARSGGWRLLIVGLISVILLATPGPLVGMGVIQVLNRREIPGFTYLYDRTIAAPALAQAARSLPILLLIVWHAIAHFDRSQQEAAALDGCGPWTILRKIVLPQRWPALAAAWGFAVAIALGDVSCSLLVIPPGMDTVARRIFGLVHSGVDDQVAAACLLLMTLLAGLAIAVRSFTARATA